MNRIIIASKNKGKIEEFQKLFHPFGLTIQSLLDFPDAIDVEETGTTFYENAQLKSEAIAKIYNTVAIADDSGLEIDALDGRPGVYSARYAGEDKADEANIAKVLEELKEIPFEQRTAHFTCVLSISAPNIPTRFVKGECHGLIAQQPTGTLGFGYDPIFYIPEFKKTFAELESEQKNKLSHRAMAMKELQVIWPTIKEEFLK
ncbi:non-canonical purine NTP pyrophosphatase [Pullulanibacillus camelliae]|uniref:dITP/XTP pyrophosphatase n=1 Tax=Pullulanibacillus camelliae TaxID=1707096 RepID=A0A8J2VUZ7_9BACL|nr:XTP/dITP diphosphatase [Pullulanibacillus camelliae]GGE42477.1 non-canonical purine NTP pyrophosphatase [Pullulanibacillus camelliae]